MRTLIKVDTLVLTTTARSENPLITSLSRSTVRYECSALMHHTASDLNVMVSESPAAFFFQWLDLLGPISSRDRLFGPKRSRLRKKNGQSLPATSFTRERLALCNGKPRKPTTHITLLAFCEFQHIQIEIQFIHQQFNDCLLYTSPSPRDS